MQFSDYSIKVWNLVHTKSLEPWTFSEMEPSPKCHFTRPFYSHHYWIMYNMITHKRWCLHPCFDGQGLQWQHIIQHELLTFNGGFSYVLIPELHSPDDTVVQFGDLNICRCRAIAKMSCGIHCGSFNFCHYWIMSLASFLLNQTWQHRKGDVNLYFLMVKVNSVRRKLETSHDAH